ncbi:DEAD (Asp-Glu-Ala-Asp) box polypeptide 41 [Datura stramonium]|uniref:DEAD (Asp-Glu-Ala-Asp) box polypeptide 41 n=1 Tax=Datura stramonium TaxID=4076 RepID=A0ABS8RTV2_DATST|nr:DEAD (Asp-Glu-Ala-Asp) box polypeptide 41 [Datura stramonium]
MEGQWVLHLFNTTDTVRNDGFSLEGDNALGVEIVESEAENGEFGGELGVGSVEEDVLLGVGFQEIEEDDDYVEYIPVAKRRAIEPRALLIPSLCAGVKPPLAIEAKFKKACDAIRKQWHIIVEGDDVTPPIKNFKDMRFPEPILKKLRAKGIVQPTPIQVRTSDHLSDWDMMNYVSGGSVTWVPGKLCFWVYLTLDEADRLVDLGFEDDIREVAGAANLDVIQEVEYVKQEAKIVYLLECLQKTPPPVLVFCENKADKQSRIPPVLAELNDPMDDVDAITDASGVKGCAYCGGLGHRVRDCPKLDHQSQQIANSRRDYFGSGGYRGEN